MDGNQERRQQAAQGRGNPEQQSRFRNDETEENQERGPRAEQRAHSPSDKHAYNRGNGQGRSELGNGEPSRNVTEVALRGTALLLDLQLETARNVWHTQARTAAMLGMPDFSGLFRVGDERARRVFSAGTEQIVTTLRHATDTVMSVQREIGRLAEQQAIGITDQMREQVERLGWQTERGLQEIQRMTREESDELQRQARRGLQSSREQWDDAENTLERGMDYAGRSMESVGRGMEQGGRGVEQGGRGLEHRGAEGRQSDEGGEPRGEASRHADEGDQRPAGREERHGRDNKARAKA